MIPTTHSAGSTSNLKPASPAATRSPALGEESAFCAAPHSAAIIRSVIMRRNGAAPVLDRAAQQREAADRDQLCATLQRLHQIGAENTPEPLRQIVREPEVERAAALLRRLSLTTPRTTPEGLLAHCERAAAEEVSYHVHVLDPFQLRHVLTYHEDMPHEELTTVEIYELERAAEHGQDVAVFEWFRRVGARHRALPRGTTAFLRSLLWRHCVAGINRERLASLAFELAVLDVRMSGVLGWENTRLFYALLKQIAGAEVPGLESYLESKEVAQAIARHRMTGTKRQLDYLQSLETAFDYTSLPTIERNIFAAAEQRGREAPVPAAKARPAPATRARRGLVASLFAWALPANAGVADVPKAAKAFAKA